MNLIGIFIAFIRVKDKEVFGAVQIGHRRIIFLNGLIDIISLCLNNFGEGIFRIGDERFSGNIGQIAVVYKDCDKDCNRCEQDKNRCNFCLNGR